jgi:glutathione-specific gamma-glutamylcyclotransferase
MQSLWVFGYGSLMWRPGFRFLRREVAMLRGYHRRLCVYSHVHRGTPGQPGLVMGLDRGGACAGIAFEIEAGQAEETIAYLRAREQVTSVYLERQVNVTLSANRQGVKATTYVVDRAHHQYAPKMRTEQLLPYVLNGRGVSGHCLDYVTATAEHLHELGIHDHRLESLMALIRTQAATNSS